MVDKVFCSPMGWPLPSSPVRSLRAECWNACVRTHPSCKRLDLTAECVRLRSFSLSTEESHCNGLGAAGRGQSVENPAWITSGQCDGRAEQPRVSVPSTSACVSLPLSEPVRTHHACFDSQPRRMRRGLRSHNNCWEWTPTLIESSLWCPAQDSKRASNTRKKKIHEIYFIIIENFGVGGGWSRWLCWRRHLLWWTPEDLRKSWIPIPYIGS